MSKIPFGVKTRTNDMLGITVYYAWTGVGARYKEGGDWVQRFMAVLDSYRMLALAKLRR